MKSVTVLDFEIDEELGMLDADWTLDTEDEYLRETYEELTGPGGVEVLNPVETEEGEGQDSFLGEPGDQGFLRAVVDHLPSPHTVEDRVLQWLPGYSSPGE